MATVTALLCIEVVRKGPATVGATAGSDCGLWLASCLPACLPG